MQKRCLYLRAATGHGNSSCSRLHYCSVESGGSGISRTHHPLQIPGYMAASFSAGVEADISPSPGLVGFHMLFSDGILSLSVTSRPLRPPKLICWAMPPSALEQCHATKLQGSCSFTFQDSVVASALSTLRFCHITDSLPLCMCLPNG